MRSQLVTGAILEVSLTVGSFLEQILLTNFVRQWFSNCLFYAHVDTTLKVTQTWTREITWTNDINTWTNVYLID